MAKTLDQFILWLHLNMSQSFKEYKIVLVVVNILRESDNFFLFISSLWTVLNTQ